ncbi:MAG TPA: VOC family protein [Actinomycetota bacterium]|nr:VOC family protein [Actinomycetota bacterium]
MLKIDHIVYSVTDLDEAGERLRRRSGLASVPGGRHPGWGTANRIVPLGSSYIELMALVDPAEARSDPVGSGLAQLLRAGEGPMLWVVSTDDLDAVAGRLGLAVQAKARELPDGSRVSWRTAGLEMALGRPELPFFIEWGVPPERHPGRMACAQPVQPEGIAWVQVRGDAGAVAEWLGGEDVACRVSGGGPGPDGVTAVGIAAPGGEIVLQ